MKKIILIISACLALMGCPQETEIIREVSTINNIPIVWKGSLNIAPTAPGVGWAYYNTIQKAAFIWDGAHWKILAQDGISIIWRGELPAAPSNPQTNWAYYNIIDGNSYIYNGIEWDLLAKAGKDGTDGASSILLWLGSLAQAPQDPATGNAYYNSTEGVSYIWDGTSWGILAKDGINGINGSDGSDGSDGIGVLWKGATANPPLNPQINWAYYNTTTNKSYIWDGSTWQIMAESGDSVITVSIDWKGSLTSAPLNPQIGWMYYNSVLGKTYIWDGTVWSIVAQDGINGQDGNSPVGFLITWKGGLANAPVNPEQGWTYYNTSQKKSFIWDGSAWQILAQDGINGKDGQPGQDGDSPAGFLITWKGGLASAPENPEQGWAYYDISQKKSFIWDGSAWQILAQDGTGGGGADIGPWLYVILQTNHGNYTQYNTTTFDTINFGKIGVGSSTRTSTFTIGLIGGNGNNTLNLTGNPSIQVSGDDMDCFSVIQPSATTATTVTYIVDAIIVFKPNSLGVKTATITIPNDSPDEPDFSFTVQGEGSLWPKTYDSGEGDGDDQIT